MSIKKIWPLFKSLGLHKSAKIFNSMRQSNCEDEEYNSKDCLKLPYIYVQLLYYTLISKIKALW